MARRLPTDEDRLEALRRLLSGLADGADVHELTVSIAPLHPKNNTFPGEVFMGLAADALDAAGTTRHEPIPYEGLRETYLPECEFRGRDNRKIQFALLTLAQRCEAGSSPTCSMRWCGGAATTTGDMPCTRQLH